MIKTNLKPNTMTDKLHVEKARSLNDEENELFVGIMRSLQGLDIMKARSILNIALDSLTKYATLDFSKPLA